MSRFRRIWPTVLALLALLNFLACGNEDSPIAPKDALRTEVTVDPDEFIAGIRPNIEIRLIAMTPEPVVADFLGVGYRVFTANGDLAIEVLLAHQSNPVSFEVHRGHDKVTNLPLSTLRSHLEGLPVVHSWLLENDELPLGEYTISAGLIGYEDVYFWGSTVFVVTEPAVSKRDSCMAF